MDYLYFLTKTTKDDRNGKINFDSNNFTLDMQRDNRAVKMGKEEEVFSYRKETQGNI